MCRYGRVLGGGLGWWFGWFRVVGWVRSVADLVSLGRFLDWVSPGRGVGGVIVLEKERGAI